MSTSNWIELALIIIAATIGIILKVKYRRKVKNIAAYVGFTTKQSCHGNVLGIYGDTDD